MKIRSLVVIAALAASSGLAACGNGEGAASAGGDSCGVGPESDTAWVEVLEAAKSEGEVSLYHMDAPDHMQQVIDEFEKACPAITVRPTRGGPELLARAEAEIANDQDGADVFMWGDAQWFKNNADALAEANTPDELALPEKGQVVPNKAVVAQYFIWSSMCWNTRKFPDGFESLEDLADPKAEGQLGMTDVVTTASAEFYDFTMDQYGDDYVRKLGAQNPKFYPSVVPTLQGVASGEVGVMSSCFLFDAAALKEQGAPLDWTVSEPVFAGEHVQGILAKSDAINAARVWLAFVQSQAGQDVIAGSGFFGSAREVEGGVDVTDAQITDSSKYPKDVMNKWNAQYKEWTGR